VVNEHRFCMRNVIVKGMYADKSTVFKSKTIPIKIAYIIKQEKQIENEQSIDNEQYLNEQSTQKNGSYSKNNLD